ncbi:MAG: hypothetical protein WCF28_06140 [Methanobacterium sp.]|uniref:hypothetical protein n=1 Tax=Methanobacterium sp. TaxID=2164 RepID=UPI003C717655
MYPTPTKININSPIVTASGGETEKKNSAWSAGAIRKMSTASITAIIPANLVFLNHNKAIPARGINNPTIVKKTANHSVRISGVRVSNPSGVNKKPTMKPTPNRTASILPAFVKRE